MKSFEMPKMFNQVRYANDYGLPCVKSSVGKPPYGCGMNGKERKFS